MAGFIVPATAEEEVRPPLSLGLVGLLGLGSQGRRPVTSALPETLPCSLIVFFQQNTSLSSRPPAFRKH